MTNLNSCTVVWMPRLKPAKGWLWDAKLLVKVSIMIDTFPPTIMEVDQWIAWMDRSSLSLSILIHRK